MRLLSFAYSHTLIVVLSRVLCLVWGQVSSRKKVYHEFIRIILRGEG